MSIPRAPAHVAVVGAGAAGLFCADALQRCGARVSVLDVGAKRWPPASLAAAGMLGPFGEHVGAPPSAHPDLLAAGLASLALWRSRYAAFARFQGGLVFAQSASRRARLAVVMDRAASGFSLGAGALGRLEPDLIAPKDASVAFFPSEGMCDPAATLAGLRARIAAAGGALVQCAVERLEPRSGGWRLSAGDAIIDADSVVLAPGALGSTILRPFAPELGALRPMRGELAVLAGAGAALSRAVRMDQAYLAPMGPDLLVGATMRDDRLDHDIDDDAVQRFARSAIERLPRTAGAAVTGRVGVRAMTADWGPLVGPTARPGLLLACGLSRNGWLLGPLVAEMIAAYVMDDAAPPFGDSFRPSRFQEPGDVA